MINIRLNFKEESKPTIRGWLYWLASLSAIVVFGAGWGAYFLGSVLYICLGLLGKETKAGLPVGIVAQMMPVLVLYGMFVWKSYRQFLQGNLGRKALYLFFSFILMVLWLGYLGTGTLIDNNIKCQFYGKVLFEF